MTPHTHFNLLVYGTGFAGRALLEDCAHVADAALGGSLYDLGESTALLMYGTAPVSGRVVCCPVARLAQLDEAQDVAAGVFRRVGAEAATADGRRIPCWVYTAGPALSRLLLPERRIAL